MAKQGGLKIGSVTKRLFIRPIKGIFLIVTVGLIEELPGGECVTVVEGDAQSGLSPS